MQDILSMLELLCKVSFGFVDGQAADPIELLFMSFANFVDYFAEDLFVEFEYLAFW